MAAIGNQARAQGPAALLFATVAIAGLVALLCTLPVLAQRGEAEDLFESLWTLTGMEGRAFSGDEPNIEFDRAEMRASGSGGCNRFNGGFETNGSALTFSPIAATKRACLDADLNNVETSFLRLLQTTTRFEVEANTLRLFADGEALLTFTGRPAGA